MYQAFTVEAANAGLAPASDRSLTARERPGSQSQIEARASRVLVRTLDILTASLALVFFLPLMAGIAVAILVTGGGPVLFVQSRVGRSGVAFNCFKFRTMRDDADILLAALLNSDPLANAEWARVHKLRNDPRVGKLGAILRKTSLDELPQLFNVLIGDMSMVGPRPVVAKEAQRYGRYFADYCAVRPGITGLWQISGRNDTTYRRRVACDVVYSRSKSAANDLMIMVKTVPVVLLGRGAY